jgi:hypothetical protein
MARKSAKGVASASPLRTITPASDLCLELQDHSRVTRRAGTFFGLKNGEPGQIARLAEQFLQHNTSLLRMMDVEVRRDFDGREVLLRIQSGSAVGAIPLISPTSARHDFGLVIQPRFPWKGIGPMLAEMGWLVSPQPLRLPLLKRSERRVPPWVLSHMVLARLRALLEQLDRRFEMVSEVRPAPRGTVDWTGYATRQLTRGAFLNVPCTFPDLRDDRQLKGAIRYAVERHLRSLQTQVEHGAFVHQLIALAEGLLSKLLHTPARRPAALETELWMRRPLRSLPFFDGLQAIAWTVDDRGLAGLSDLEGLPWTLPMEQFFEAYVETVMRKVAQQTGAALRCGRKRETVAPLQWDPPYLGSQRSLLPDILLESEDLTIIVDAKYKRHWQELQGDWRETAIEIQEQHRADLLQVLAYANLARSRRVVCCLLYPCAAGVWDSLREGGRLFHRALLPQRERAVEVWLTAIPMGTEAAKISSPFVEQIRKLRAADSRLG